MNLVVGALWSIGVAFAEGPQDDWLELVLRASGQDGATSGPEELLSAAADLCRGGIEGACTYPTWGRPFDPAAARKALDTVCDAGDPVACLVSGWALGQEPWGTWSQRSATALDARLRVERACTLGLERGCVEVARALFHGVGTTARPNKARERLGVLCRDAEASACGVLGDVTRDNAARRDLLARAVDLGFVPALRSLAVMPDADRLLFHDAACTAGVGASCRDLASLDPALTRNALERGCRVQHAGSCSDLAVSRFATGETAEGLAALDALCGPFDEACARAALLRLDVQPRATLGGTLGPIDRELLESELKAGVWSCYVDRLGRGEAGGPLSVFVQVGPTGRIEGGAGIAPYADAELQRCIDSSARRLMPTVPPVGGAALVRFETFLGHAAEVRFRPSNAEPDPGTSAIVDALTALSPMFEACALLDPREAAPIGIEIVVRRSGSVSVLEVQRSSEVAAIDACVAQAVRHARVDAVAYRTDGVLLVRFLQALSGQAEPEDR